MPISSCGMPLLVARGNTGRENWEGWNLHLLHKHPFRECCSHLPTHITPVLALLTKGAGIAGWVLLPLTPFWWSYRGARKQAPIGFQGSNHLWTSSWVFCVLGHLGWCMVHHRAQFPTLPSARSHFSGCPFPYLQRIKAGVINRWHAGRSGPTTMFFLASIVLFFELVVKILKSWYFTFMSAFSLLLKNWDYLASLGSNSLLFTFPVISMGWVSRISMARFKGMHVCLF